MLEDIHLGSYNTGAVQMWENFFPFVASKYPSSVISSDPRHVDVSSILFSNINGVFARCWRWTASLIDILGHFVINNEV